MRDRNFEFEESEGTELTGSAIAKKQKAAMKITHKITIFPFLFISSPNYTHTDPYDKNF